MAFDRQAAKEAGYTDDEINAFIAANPAVEDKNAQQKQLADEPPAPQTVIPELSRGTEMAATLGVAAKPVIEGVAAAAPYAAGAAAGWYLKNKAGQVIDKGMELGKNVVEQMRESNAIQQAREARLQNRPGFGGTPTAGTPTSAPTAGTPNYGNIRYNVPTGNVPVAPQGPVSTGPVAPGPTAPPAAPTAPAQAQPSLLDKTTNMVRQLAANKVFQNLAKGGAGVAAALTPGNIGQDYMVPQTGRMRGMEINPMTGRPWTREQLQAYNANPAMFDTALGQAQMPR